MFKTGQQVVCIDDQFDPWVFDLYKSLPKKDQIYTVRALRAGRSNPKFTVTDDAGRTDAVTTSVRISGPPAPPPRSPPEEPMLPPGAETPPAGEGPPLGTAGGTVVVAGPVSSPP
jgi:hypothetical protein